MFDMIFLSDNDYYDKSIKNYISTNFSVIDSDFDGDQIAKIMEKNTIRLIIAWIDEIRGASSVELRRLVKYTKDVHFCLLGEHDHCLEMMDSMNNPLVHGIDIPISITKFVDNFTYIVENFVGREHLDMSNAARKKHILLVDDDPVCLRNMMNWLKIFYKVSVTKSGQECLTFLETKLPDLILLDYEMPEMNGIQTLEKIRQIPYCSEIPVVFLTGVSDMNKVKEALAHKPQGYILKNTDRTEFVNKVNSVLR